MVSQSARPGLVVLAGLLAGLNLILVSASAVAKDEATRREDLLARVTNAIDGHVIPALQNLVRTTEALTRAIEVHCSRSDAGSLRGVEAALADTVEAWAAARHLRFGPLRDAGRVARFHFWPDPRRVTARQMRRIFLRNDPKLLDPQILAGQSVAIQGLGALESYVLFERSAISEGARGRTEDYECRYAYAVARLTEAEARSVLSEWKEPDGWRKRLTSPSAENEIYRTAEESTAQLVKSLLLGLQLVREQNIVPLYELSTSRTKRVRVPFQRLGLNDESVRAALASLASLNEALALTDFARGRTAWVKSWTANGFASLLREAADLNVPDALALSPSDLDVAQVRQIRFFTNALRQIIARQTAPSAGLTIGFNELDGD